MKDVLKIDFVDFWPGFVKTDNYLFNVLSKRYVVKISEDPEVLFYSCYGNSYLGFNCLRIFYTAENIRPDYTACDYSLSFDYTSDERNFRLPLYAFYIDQREALAKMLEPPSREMAVEIWKAKKKFCCMVVSNGLSKKRVKFFHSLSKVVKVDSGGKYLNNVGGPVVDKLDFIKDYKFVIAFENSSHEGYTTEKILDPMMVNSIPIYWGNPLIANDFNSKAFVNYSQFGSEKEVINEILRIESNFDAAVEIICQPKFPENKVPQFIDVDNVLKFLVTAIESRKLIVPVSQTNRRLLHYFKRRYSMAEHYFRVFFMKNFR
jgi:hypothetical protein